MNRKTLGTLLGGILLIGLGACNSSHYTPPPPQETIAATSGSPQSATVSTAFAAPLVATVTTGSTADSGVSVTFTAPGSGASGTFAGGGATATVTTDSNGHATSPVFTANGTAGSYTVTATASGATGNASFSLSNTSVAVITQNFSFYAAGTDTFNDFNYTIAGSVVVDSSGNVTGGEQDFNDGGGLTSPEPSGDSITGGSLVVDSVGQGTLTLTTDNANYPTETFAVDFVNGSHALITQFDAIATSTGSIDLQSLPVTPAIPTGAFAFGIAGLDPNFFTLTAGGVFSLNNTSLIGTIDIDDGGSTVLGSAFTGTVSTPDSFGRGSVTNTNVGITFAYYIVGPEAMRIIDVDTTDIGLGSAFGQGDFSGGFGASSIGPSVISSSGIPVFVPVVMAGQIVTNPAASTFTGVADEDEYGFAVSASSINGTYTMGGDGYGSLTITNGGAQDVSVFGMYAVDPNLDINDPNNATGGGGAILVDLDADANVGGVINTITGIGVLVPQTDVATDSFSGPYAFNGQFQTTNDEADFVGFGTMSGSTFSGTGGLNDPFGDFVSTAINTGVTFGGTATPDGGNPGRYDMDPLNMTVPGSSAISLTVAIYQANGGQLFWIEEDSSSMFSGQLQQQPSNPPFPAVKKAGTKVTAAKAAAPKAVSPKTNK